MIQGVEFVIDAKFVEEDERLLEGAKIILLTVGSVWCAFVLL